MDYKDLTREELIRELKGLRKENDSLKKSFDKNITELRKKEKTMQDIIAKNPMSIQIVDKEGFTLQVNPAHTNLFGAVPPSDYSVFTDKQVERQGLTQMFDRAKNGEVVYFPDFYYNAHMVASEFPDVPIWIRMVVFPINDSSGKPERFVLMHENITESKKSLDALQLFKDLIEFSSDAVGMSTPQGKHYYQNDTFTNWFGYAGENPSDTIYADHELGKYIFKTLMDGGSWQGEIRMYNKDKNIIDVFLRAFAIKDTDGKVLGLVGLHSDITERKRSEKALQESESNNRLLIDLAPDAFFQGDEKGNIIMANKRATLLTGYSKEELLSMNIKALFPESALNQKPLRYDLLDKGETVTIERDIARKDGSVVIVEMTSRKMPNKTYQSFMRDISERKKTEAALRDSEYLYRTVFENTGTSTIIIEEDTTIAMVNSEWINLTGYSREEMENKMSWTKFVVPEDLARMKEYHSTRRADPGSAPRKYEFRFIRRNGEIRNVLNCVAMIPESKRSIASLMDITERKIAEESLIESEEKLKAIIETSPDGIAITSLEGTVQFVTRQTVSLWGYNATEELTGKNLIEFIHPAYHEKAKFFINEMINGHLTGAAEYLMVRKDGSVFYCESNANILRDVNSNPIGILFINRDITERKQVETELIKAKELAEESEERYRIFIEQTTDGVFRMEFDEPMRLDLPIEEMIDFLYDHSLVVECNKAFMKMYRTENPEDIIGKSQTDFHGGKMNPANREVMRKFITQGFIIQQEVTEEFDIYGNVRYFSNSSVGIFNKEGNLIRIWGTQTDITEKKIFEIELIKAKEKAEESDRLKSAFLANMSHEIRTPMNGILGFADLLKQPHLSGEEQQEYVSIIEKSGARMLNIINDIIDISKIESGVMKVFLSETNINEQIEYVYTFFRPEVEKKGLTLLIKSILPTEEATISTDREKIYAILINLIKNAIKFTDKGSIEIGYTKKGAFLEFFIKDTGVGIPEDRQQAVFERFVQADIGDKRAFQGAGLGLSITKAFVEMLGGRIWFESEEGKGSVFHFTIPYNTVTEKKREKTSCRVIDPIPGINNLKVLIAEDDETSDLYLTLLLEKYNCELLHVRTGVETVEACRNNPDIDLILMDIKLPEMNGYEAAMKIREFNTKVVIIAQTAYALAGDKERAIESGCNNYITKPVNKTLLSSLIKRYFK